jgi:hypothetical protein
MVCTMSAPSFSPLFNNYFRIVQIPGLWNLGAIKVVPLNGYYFSSSEYEMGVLLIQSSSAVDITVVKMIINPPFALT